jgi:hypothetical protein
MAASVAKRDMVYFTWNDEKLAISMRKVYDLIKTKATVAQLWSCLMEYSSHVEKGKSLELFDYLIAKFENMVT